MKILGALLLLQLLATDLCLHAQTASSFPIRIVDQRPVVDGVFLNGQGPFRFLLDTGSQSNLIDARLARTVGLQSSGSVILLTPSGRENLVFGKMRLVALGPMQAHDEEFLETGLDAWKLLPSGTAGILGQDFLSHFDYLLDLQHRGLSLTQAPLSGQKVPFSLIFGRMALPTNLGLLVLDSGASTLSVFREVPGWSTAKLTDATGHSVAVSLRAAPRLTIGSNVYHLDQAVYHSVPSAQEAGLLPTCVFHALYVSNSGGYVLINPTQ